MAKKTWKPHRRRVAKRCSGCQRAVSAPHGHGCPVASSKKEVRHQNIEAA